MFSQPSDFIIEMVLFSRNLTWEWLIGADNLEQAKWSYNESGLMMKVVLIQMCFSGYSTTKILKTQPHI